MSDAVKNFCLVDSSAGYDASATSIVLVTNHGQLLPLPSSDGAFNAVWWNSTDYPDPALQHRAYVLGTETEDAEIVRVTARSTDTLTITRAQEGTTATTHNKSGKTYSIMLGITAKTITDITPGAFPKTAFLTSDDVVTSGSYVAVTGFSFPVVSGKLYRISGAINMIRQGVQNIFAQFVAPTSSVMRGVSITQISTTSVNLFSEQATPYVFENNTSTSFTRYFDFILTAGSSGNFELQTKNGDTSVTVKAGSSLTIEEVR